MFDRRSRNTPIDLYLYLGEVRKNGVSPHLQKQETQDNIGGVVSLGNRNTRIHAATRSTSLSLYIGRQCNIKTCVESMFEEGVREGCALIPTDMPA